MKAYLLDVHNNRARTVEVGDEDRLEEYYKLLNCSTIDITSRQIEGKYFDIVCDDEGLFNEPVIVSALDSNGEPALCGSLLFCNYDGEGGETSLTDEDIALLRKHTAVAVKKDRATGKELDYVVVMTDVDY